MDLSHASILTLKSSLPRSQLEQDPLFADCARFPLDKAPTPRFRVPERLQLICATLARPAEGFLWGVDALGACGSMSAAICETLGRRCACGQYSERDYTLTIVCGVVRSAKPERWPAGQDGQCAPNRKHSLVAAPQEGYCASRTESVPTHMVVCTVTFSSA